MGMRRTLIKLTLTALTFLISLYVAGRIMNRDNNNMTVEMSAPTFPVVVLEKEGVYYDELHGYGQAMEPACLRDTVAELGENRELAFRIDTYGQTLTDITMEVRSCDGERLVENTRITEYETRGEGLYVQTALKDLLEKDTEYALTLILTTGEGRQIRYYTRVVWSDQTFALEKIQFVQDFHEKTFDKEAALDLTKYLESSAQGDNTTFHKVDIHSSFQQITWGDLEVREVGEPVIQLTQLAPQTASLEVLFFVETGSGKNRDLCQAKEFFRIRYTPDRVYLLDYEREMTRLLDVKGDIYGNDKIALGIAGEDTPLMESADGNVVAFQVAGRLCSYNSATNRIALLFSFWDEKNQDARSIWREHEIKILEVDEGGNVIFAVYGYMNRGRHEGEVGLLINRYDSARNTVEESVYLPVNKTYRALACDLEKLLYLNREGILYFYLDHRICQVDLSEKTSALVAQITDDEGMQISESHRMGAWQQESGLVLMNFGEGSRVEIPAGREQRIVPLGFMGEDLIYGLARREDIQMDQSGRHLIPMYLVCIRDQEGKLLKEYQQEDIYVLSCTTEENQITLERVQRDQNGELVDIVPEHIMNNERQEESKNKLAVAAVDVYEKIVQLQVRSQIDSKTLQVLTPKEVSFEGERAIYLPASETVEEYRVYAGEGMEGSYYSPALAVRRAYETSGLVEDEGGHTVWIKGNRLTRNQIMAIGEVQADEEHTSMALCLETILNFEGISRDCGALLSQGESPMEILQENMEDVRILDLEGCPLDAVLYYVNQDIPVLATLRDGEAVLVVGFNQFNTVILEPSTGRLYKKGMNDSAQWFEENGNPFLTYVRKGQ